MQSKSWDIDEVNSVDFSKLEIGSINASVAQSIGITDATDFFQVIRIPWSSPYPNQILLTLSGKQRMYYRACSNGTWETPKRLITNADLQTGRISSTNCPAGEITTIDVNFNRLFSGTPNVVASINSNSSSIKYKDLTITVTNISSNGFTIQLYNGSDTQFAPSVDWIAAIA